MSRPRVLDTNRLIAHWRRSRKGSLSAYTEKDATAWAKTLIDLAGTPRIVTPVVIEFLCGARDRHELSLCRAFLSEFEIVDRGTIQKEDWEKTRDFASWVSSNGSPRDFADRLIAAITRRLGFEVLTSDDGFPRSH